MKLARVELRARRQLRLEKGTAGVYQDDHTAGTRRQKRQIIFNNPITPTPRHSPTHPSKPVIESPGEIIPRDPRGIQPRSPCKHSHEPPEFPLTLARRCRLLRNPRVNRVQNSGFNGRFGDVASLFTYTRVGDPPLGMVLASRTWPASDVQQAYFSGENIRDRPYGKRDVVQKKIRN